VFSLSLVLGTTLRLPALANVLRLGQLKHKKVTPPAMGRDVQSVILGACTTCYFTNVGSGGHT